MKETLHDEIANNQGFIEIMEEIWSLMKEILTEVENQIPTRGLTRIYNLYSYLILKSAILNENLRKALGVSQRRLKNGAKSMG